MVTKSLVFITIHFSQILVPSNPVWKTVLFKIKVKRATKGAHEDVSGSKFFVLIPESEERKG